MGDPFEVQPSHQSRYRLIGAPEAGMWITRDRAVFTMTERTDNVWLAELQDVQ